MNNYLSSEARIMAHFMLFEYETNVFAIEKTDHQLEEVLDSKLYDKLIELAHW